MAREGLSRGDLLLLAAILAAAGIVVSAFLTWQWYTGAASGACDISSFFSCSTVRNSPWASVAGIPTSAAGLGGFVVLLGLSVAALRGMDSLGPWSADAWLLGFAVLGALVGLGLTYLELFVIGAVCVFCAAGFALDLGILAVGSVFWRRRRTGASG
jgi:uncharacterized membrane protein